MFCPYCGTQLSDNARFCVSCGNQMPVQEPENVEGYYGDYYEESVKAKKVKRAKAPNGQPTGKKSRLPLFIGIGAAAAAVIVALVLVFVLGVFKSDEQRIEDATKKTARALASRMDVTQFIYDYLNGEQLGLEVSSDGDGLSTLLYGSYGAGIRDAYDNMDLKFAFDRNGNVSMNLETSPYGEEINAGYYADAASGSRDLAVSFSSITDDTLGADLSRLGADMQSSIFYPSRGGNYALSGYMYSQIMSIGGMLASLPEMLNTNDYREFIDDIKTNEATRPVYTREKTSINAGGGSVNCDAIKTTLSSDQLKSILKKFRNFQEDRMSDVGMDYYNYYVRDQLEYIIEGIDETDPVLNIEYDIYRGYLVRIVASLSGGEETPFAITLGVLFGADPRTTDSVTIAVDAKNVFDGSGDWREAGTLTFDLSKIENNEIYATLDSSASNIYFNFGFRYNSGTFELSAWNDYRQFVLEGDMTMAGSTLEISDPEFYRNGERIARLRGLDVTFNKAPQIRKLAQDYPEGYSNVLKMTEREFGRVADDFIDFSERL